MSFNKQNYFQRRTKPKGPKTNDRIRALEVQVISSDKKNLGTFAIKEANDKSVTIRRLGSEKQETLSLDQAIKKISQQNKFPIN